MKKKGNTKTKIRKRKRAADHRPCLKLEWNWERELYRSELWVQYTQKQKAGVDPWPTKPKEGEALQVSCALKPSSTVGRFSKTASWLATLFVCRDEGRHQFTRPFLLVATWKPLVFTLTERQKKKKKKNRDVSSCGLSSAGKQTNDRYERPFVCTRPERKHVTRAAVSSRSVGLRRPEKVRNKFCKENRLLFCELFDTNSPSEPWYLSLQLQPQRRPRGQLSHGNRRRRSCRHQLRKQGNGEKPGVKLVVFYFPLRSHVQRSNRTASNNKAQTRLKPKACLNDLLGCTLNQPWHERFDCWGTKGKLLNIPPCFPLRKWRLSRTPGLCSATRNYGKCVYSNCEMTFSDGKTRAVLLLFFHVRNVYPSYQWPSNAAQPGCNWSRVLPTWRVFLRCSLCSGPTDTNALRRERRKAGNETPKYPWPPGNVLVAPLAH